MTDMSDKIRFIFDTDIGGDCDDAGALAMLISLVIVPIVSLVTKPVPFEVDPPTPESGTDRELAAEIAEMPDEKSSTRREIVAGANQTEIDLE